MWIPENDDAHELREDLKKMKQAAKAVKERGLIHIEEMDAKKQKAP